MVVGFFGQSTILEGTRRFVLHGCNFAIFFHGLKLFFTGVIFYNFSRANNIFHGQFERFFRGLHQHFKGERPKFFTEDIFFAREKILMDMLSTTIKTLFMLPQNFRK